MNKLTKYEMETIVNYNAAEQTATVYTRDKSVMRKLDRLVKAYPESYRLVDQTDIDKTYSMPKSYVTYRKPRVCVWIMCGRCFTSIILCLNGMGEDSYG